MKVNKKKVSINEAAEILGVERSTVKVWISRGRLSVVDKSKKEDDIRIPSSALPYAFDVVCIWCEKTFHSSHPEQARYCSRKHKDLYRYWDTQANRKKLLAQKRQRRLDRERRSRKRRRPRRSGKK